MLPVFPHLDPSNVSNWFVQQQTQYRVTLLASAAPLYQPNVPAVKTSCLDKFLVTFFYRDPIKYI